MKTKLTKRGSCPARAVPLKRDAGAEAASRRKELDKAVESIECAYLASARFSIKDLSSRVLEAAQKFTGSSYGFAAYIDPHTGWMTAPTLSRDVWKGHLPPGEPLVFKKFGGLWGWALKNKKTILTNAAASDPRSGGTPAGHIKINKFLAAPAIFNTKLAGLIALANPARDYGPEDLAAVKRLARVYAIIIQRKLAEDRIKESEEQYRAIINASQDIIYTINLEGRLTYVSGQAANYGYSPRSMIGRHVMEFTHPDDRYMISQALARAVKTGATRSTLRYRIKKKDGTYFHAEQKAGVILKDGKPFSISCVIRDVTERRELDLALSKLTQCFLKFGSDPDRNIGIITRTAGEIFNSACVLYNRMEGDSLRTVSDWQAPDDMSRLDKAKGHLCLKVISRAKDEVLIIRNLDKTAYAVSDPNVRKYNLKTYIGYPIKVGGKTIGSLCTVFQTDVKAAAAEIEILSILAKALGIEEQRKLSENTLKKNEETLRRIFDTATDVIFIKDLQGRYIKGNKASAATFHLRPEDLVGKTDRDLMPASYAAEAFKEDQEVLRTGKAACVSKTLTVLGRTYYLNIIKTPLKDANGTVTGLLGISRDITELKKLEEELVRAKALEAVSKVARPAAHDFNNILSAINGYATLIMETLKAGNPVKPEIAQILNAVKRAAAITRRLQTYGSKTGN